MKIICILIIIALTFGCIDEKNLIQSEYGETTKLRSGDGGNKWAKTYFINENVTCFSSGFRGGLSCMDGEK